MRKIQICQILYPFLCYQRLHIGIPAVLLAVVIINITVVILATYVCTKLVGQSNKSLFMIAGIEVPSSYEKPVELKCAHKKDLERQEGSVDPTLQPNPS